MTEYAYAPDDTIEEGPVSALPAAWRNISGLNLHPDPASIGWKPVVDADRPDYDPATERLHMSHISVTPTQITRYWEVVALTEDELPPLDSLKTQAIARVNAERDRRIRTPFTFNGTPFDYDAESQKRITGAAALAGFAMTLGGKLPEDLLWHGGDTPFTWITADNRLVQMDAPTTFALGQAAAAWESAHIFAARALKDAIDAAETRAALAAIDINEGWPE